MRKLLFLSPSELALFAYLIITGLLIIVQFVLIENAMSLLFFRIIAIALISGIAWYQLKRNTSRVFKLFRYSIPLLLLTILYTETDALNNLIFAEDQDPAISGVELFIFGFQPALVFAQRYSMELFAELMYFGYFSYYLLLILVPLYIYFKRDLVVAQRAMFIIIHSFFAFYLFFIIYPVGGPQFYFTDWPQLPQGYIFGHLIRMIQENGEAPTAAFPSSHVSICIMLIVLCFRYAKVLLKIILPVAVLLILSTVYIRAHYLVDILAAFVITPFMFIFSEFVFNKIMLINNPGQYEY